MLCKRNEIDVDEMTYDKLREKNCNVIVIMTDDEYSGHSSVQKPDFVYKDDDEESSISSEWVCDIFYFP